jgi:hypothetical protein
MSYKNNIQIVHPRPEFTFVLFLLHEPSSFLSGVRDFPVQKKVLGQNNIGEKQNIKYKRMRTS